MQLTTIALALSVAFGAQAPATNTIATPLPPVQTVREYVADYFSDAPIMVAIAGCESHFKQYDSNGAVHRGVQNNKDVGVMQINEYYHLKRSQELGIDIYTVQGNTEYARYLYEREGTTPWLSSSACWGKNVHSPIAVAQ